MKGGGAKASEERGRGCFEVTTTTTTPESDSEKKKPSFAAKKERFFDQAATRKLAGKTWLVADTIFFRYLAGKLSYSSLRF